MEEADVDDMTERRHRVQLRRHLGEDLPLELADVVLDRLEEQLLLVAEVVVDRALGDARVARDAVDRRALVAEAREAVDRGAQERLARRLAPISPTAAARR